MSDVKDKDLLRREHNQELIRRMRQGDSLTAYDSKSSWFPPRPIIEKDSEAITKLYGKNDSEKEIEKPALQVIEGELG